MTRVSMYRLDASDFWPLSPDIECSMAILDFTEDFAMVHVT